MISLVSFRSKTAKIWSENEQEISEKIDEYLYQYRRIDVSEWNSINLSIYYGIDYWCVYVCMLSAKFIVSMYIRTNPTLIGKKCKNKMYLES